MPRRKCGYNPQVRPFIFISLDIPATKNRSFKDGNYSFQHFTAIRTADNKVQVKITQKKGKYITENNDMAIVKIITDKGIYQASGNLVEGIEVQL